MLEYLKTFFPKEIERIKNSSHIAKIIYVVILILLPILLVYIWRNKNVIDKLLSADIKTTGYQILFAFLLLSLISFLSYLLLKHSKKKLLKLFIKEWWEFKKNFELLYMFIDVWLIRDRTEEKDEDLWNKIIFHLEIFWPARDHLRKLLFEIGENKLMVYENKHWIQLKNEDELFKERNYEGPFSLLLDLSAPIGEINHHRKPINWSIKISEEFIEHLCYKYPYLAKYSSKLKYT